MAIFRRRDEPRRGGDSDKSVAEFVTQFLEEQALEALEDHIEEDFEQELPQEPEFLPPPVPDEPAPPELEELTPQFKAEPEDLSIADTQEIRIGDALLSNLEKQNALAQLFPPNSDPLWISKQLRSLLQQRAKEERQEKKGAWYSEVFKKEYSYTHPKPSVNTTAREVGWIEESLNVAKGGRLLDLACGAGRHAIPLTERGYELVGLDLSIYLLQQGLIQAQEQDLKVQFVHGDMRDLSFEQVFDGIYCLDTSFGYFSDLENFGVLHGIHRALKRGGHFLLDVINRDHAIQELPRRNWWQGKSCLAQEDVEFLAEKSQVQIKRYVVFSDGTERIYDIRLRLYSPHELQQMLKLAGFEILEISGSFHTPHAFFGKDSEHIIILAKKT